MDAIDVAKAPPVCDTLSELVRLLRSREGCPWDRKQTIKTVRKYLLEEAYEVLEAMEDDGSPGMVCGELGDLLFQIIFLTCLYEERGDFALADVIFAVHRKMIRRHPHVFGDAKVADVDEVKANWQRIKLEEKGTTEAKSLLDTVPKALPALMRAHRIAERVERTGFVFPDLPGILKELEKGLSDLKHLAGKEDPEEASKELGDFLLNIAVLGRLAGLNAEESLNQAIQRLVKDVASSTTNRDTV